MVTLTPPRHCIPTNHRNTPTPTHRPATWAVIGSLGVGDVCPEPHLLRGPPLCPFRGRGSTRPGNGMPERVPGFDSSQRNVARPNEYRRPRIQTNRRSDDGRFLRRDCSEEVRRGARQPRSALVALPTNAGCARAASGVRGEHWAGGEPLLLSPAGIAPTGLMSPLRGVSRKAARCR